ncbi:MAG: hypothetical protein KDJ48_13170 [Nitratireductor sp.]|nr:hypothetical protein [Nitratireductor sp.]MCB1456959.1 hypothetical protein [Nitratireductor sp.]MCB1460187.1 hypothetical protein [Nitratireductor sp.]
MDITRNSFFVRLAGLFLVAGIYAASTTMSASQSELPDPVDTWYEALKSADRETFDQIIAEAAMIELKYLDVIQTKDEFIESLDSWEDIADGVSIRTRLVSATAESATVEVCYRFPDNERLNIENFVFSDGLIRSSVQELKAETCDGL